ncbi:hypothetical protein MKX03_010708, partial [Papaver bracteatum]
NQKKLTRESIWFNKWLLLCPLSYRGEGRYCLKLGECVAVQIARSVLLSMCFRVQAVALFVSLALSRRKVSLSLTWEIAWLLCVEVVLLMLSRGSLNLDKQKLEDNFVNVSDSVRFVFR